MANVILFGPVTYRSSCDSEAKIADDYHCHLCKQPVGLDTRYVFWFKGDTYASKDLRRAHEKCFDEKYSGGV